MNALQLFLKKLDVFGTPFSLRYEGNIEYKTPLGGLFFIIYIVVGLWYAIYYFIPFINRKNFNIVYYTMNLPYAEQINLKSTKAAFAIGFDCNKGSDGTNAEDILKLELTYTTQTKNNDGTKNREIIQLSTHPCTYSDFYNNFNDSLDYLNIDIFQCLDDNSHIVEGIYTDRVFSYYTFIVSTKEDTQENFDRVNNYLTENDCKLNVYYTDITIDLNDYKNSSRRYLDSLFIQLDPNYVKKMNAYFLNEYLYDDDYLIRVFNDDGDYKVETKFSRIEDYSLYKGLNRFQSRIDDYKNYAKLYIRAETKKTEIKRKYQKLMEYIADASSLLILIFRILVNIFNFINKFYADMSIKKKIFIFKDFKSDHLNVTKQLDQLKKLIDLTDEQKNKNKNFSNNPIEGDNGRINILNNEDIKIYKKPKKVPKKQINLDLTKEKDNLRSIIDEPPNIMSTNRKIKIKDIKKPKHNNKNKVLIKNNNLTKDKNNLNENSAKKGANEEYPLENKNNEKIEYSFNLFEIIWSSFCKCCLSKKLSLKNNINEKANKLLFHKLDITLYVRNMMLIDIINNTLLEDSMKNIINFINRPILSLNKNKDNEFESFCQTYTDNDFNKLSDEMYEFAQKSDKKIIEKIMLNISKKKLMELI